MSEKSFIPVAELDLAEFEEKLVLEAVGSRWILGIGSFVDTFERGFGDFCGPGEAAAVSSGKVGLHLAFAAKGIGKDRRGMCIR